MFYSVLITDTQCALGAVIVKELLESSFDVTILSDDSGRWHEPDFTLAYLAKNAPNLVINNFGWSDNGNSLNLENHLAVAQCLVDGCRNIGSPLIQLSNYRVFSGKKSGFIESDEPVARDNIGEVYLNSEKIVEALDKHLILRLGWVLGASGSNLLTEIASKFVAGDDAAIFSERRGSPVGHHDVARIILALVKQISCGSENWGTFHYSSSDACTEGEFAREVLSELQSSFDLGTITANVVEMDSEPVSAALGYKRLMDNFGIQPKMWRQSLSTELGLWVNHYQQHKTSCDQ
ncbi:sugar nucleotide-binding protein [Sessilibacter sp. MAH1]